MPFRLSGPCRRDPCESLGRLGHWRANRLHCVKNGNCWNFFWCGPLGRYRHCGLNDFFYS